MLLLATVQVICAGVLIAFVIVTGAPAWAPVPIIACGVLLSAAALFAAPALHRRLSRESADSTRAALYSRADRRRDVRRIWLAAAITFVLAQLLMIVLELTFPSDEPLLARGVAYSASLALIAAMFACIPVEFRLGRILRGLVDGDFDRARAITKAMTKRTPVELSPENERVAPAYAGVAWINASFALGNFVGISAAMLLLQVASLPSTSVRPFTVVSLVFFAVLLAVGTPLLLLQVRRIRRYALAHPATEESAEPPAPAAAREGGPDAANTGRPEQAADPRR